MKNKSCWFVRAAFLALCVIAAFALKTTAIAQVPPNDLLWYNGDFDGLDGLANEENTTISQAAVYDDFTVPAGETWNVAAVFSDNLASTNFTGADWEIRSDVSEGDGGTLIASGTTSSPVVEPTGRSLLGLTEYQVQVTGLNLTLTEGTYWLNVTPIGDGTGRSYDSTTSGENCFGTPCGNNENAFFTSSYFGYYFTSTGNPAIGQPYDFSMGVVSFPIPEPATLVLFSCGVGALLLLAVRRRRAA